MFRCLVSGCVVSAVLIFGLASQSFASGNWRPAHSRAGRSNVSFSFGHGHGYGFQRRSNRGCGPCVRQQGRNQSCPGGICPVR